MDSTSNFRVFSHNPNAKPKRPVNTKNKLGGKLLKTEPCSKAAKNVSAISIFCQPADTKKSPDNIST